MYQGSQEPGRPKRLPLHPKSSRHSVCILCTCCVRPAQRSVHSLSAVIRCAGSLARQLPEQLVGFSSRVYVDFPLSPSLSLSCFSLFLVVTGQAPCLGFLGASVFRSTPMTQQVGLKGAIGNILGPMLSTASRFTRGA